MTVSAHTETDRNVVGWPRRAYPDGSVMETWHARDGWPCRVMRTPGARGGHRGRMLFLGGRGDIIEKHVEAIARWAAQGWSVDAPEWRGQGGSGRLLANPLTGDSPGFDTWIADLAAYGQDWLALANGPHVAVAHSMGGHLLLRAMAQGVFRPDAAVLTAPMLGLNSGRLSVGLAVRITAFMCAIGLRDRAAWGESDPHDRMRQARLTHSAARYADEMWWRAERPDLVVGGPSWRWLEHAYASTRTLAADPALATMDVPTLVLATPVDKLVLPGVIASVVAKLPDAVIHWYGPEAAHEILREEDGVRDDALARIDRFLDSRAPAGVAAHA